jgi:Cu+-exporting ATPase
MSSAREDTSTPTRQRPPAAGPAGSTAHVDLLVGGMTCAACSSRIEKKLNRLDGVHAVVNLATASASVDFDPATADQDVLVRTVERTGYTATPAPEPGGEDPVQEQERARAANLRHRLLVSAPLAALVLAVTMVPGVAGLLERAGLASAGQAWLALLLGAPVVGYGGWPFHRAAARNARHGASTMDTLVSLGTLVAYGWSLLQALAGGGHSYVEVATTVTVFLLLGRWSEARAKHRAGSALRTLMTMGARRAELVQEDGSTREVPVETLRPGMRFVVRPGDQVATDGRVVEGRSALDGSMLTGESLPAEKGPGDEVIGATLNSDGRLVVEVTRIGRDTALARIAALVARAQSGKAPVQRLADRVSAVFVPTVLAISVVTLLIWLGTGHGVDAAFTAAVAVLVIACPCALGLATPTALLVGTGRAAQHGILIRDAAVLESTRRVDTVVLDKTGTVTTGAMGVHEVTVAETGPTADGRARLDVLRVAGAVEAASEHPVGRAIAAYSREAVGAPLPAVHDFVNEQGLGVHGVVEGRTVRVARPREEELPAPLDDAVARARSAGWTPVLVSEDGHPLAVVAVGDTVKPTSAEAVRRLHGLGLRTYLLTGDHPAAAGRAADEAGIDPGRVIAGVMPADKAEVVRRLQAEGRVVAMVGDGVNDAAALAQADLGVAMGGGTAVAIEASAITLVGGDLRAAADAIALSRRTLRTIQQNLFWAFGYNVVDIPVAALGLLDPMLAGGAMAASSVCVVGNSVRLRRFRGA